jgi:hypothetical protein
MKILSDGKLRKKMMARSLKIVKELDINNSIKKLEELYAQCI